MVVDDGWINRNWFSKVYFSVTLFYRSGYAVTGNKSFDRNYIELPVKMIPENLCGVNILYHSFR